LIFSVFLTYTISDFLLVTYFIPVEYEVNSANAMDCGLKLSVEG
jgi:hypothetical protein